MKQIMIYLLAVALACGLVVSLGYAQGDPASVGRCFPTPAGLTGWWPGDGNTHDIIGGRSAVLHRDATTGPGLVDEAFILDGVGDFVDVPHDSALNFGSGDFTVALWVFLNDTAGEQVLVEKWIQRSTTTSNGWTLTKLEENVLRLAMANTSGELRVDTPGPLEITAGTWNHFAATRQGSKVTLFMNGVPVAQGKCSLNLDSSSSLKFGHRGNPDDTPGSEIYQNYYLNGRIDEVQIFVGRALPPGLIRAIFEAGSAGMCKVLTTGEPFGVYEDWTTRFIRSDRWNGKDDPALELRREVQGRHLVLRIRREGATSDNVTSAGSYNRLRVNNPQAVNQIEADFVVENLTLIGCEANPYTRLVAAMIDLFKFNDGSSQKTGDSTGDYFVRVGAFREASSTLPEGVLTVRAFVFRCINPDCTSPSTIELSNTDMGKVQVGEKFTLRAIWERDNHRFLVGVNHKPDVILEYDPSLDVKDAGFPVADVRNLVVSANCQDVRTVADVETNVGEIRTNVSAIIP